MVLLEEEKVLAMQAPNHRSPPIPPTPAPPYHPLKAPGWRKPPTTLPHLCLTPTLPLPVTSKDTEVAQAPNHLSPSVLPPTLPLTVTH